MTSNYHGGQHVSMRGGSHNVGINTGTVNNAPAAPQDALRELADAVDALRAHLAPADRAVVDASMRTVGTAPNAEPGGFRGALRDISGVASMVGQLGVPVVEAVRRVMAAFGL